MTYQDEKSNKIWRAELSEDGTVTTFWGRADAETLQSKEFPGVCEKFFDKKVDKKIKKGYLEE